MDKFSLRELQMSAVALLSEARERARWLVNTESRGPGDTRNAMGRVARRYGIPFGALWSLRYRPPDDILLSVYLSIIAAHEAECDRQARLLDHERAVTTPKTWAGRILLRAADRLAGEGAAAVDDGVDR